MSLSQLVESVLVRRDIRATTERFYRRVIAVFVGWRGSDDGDGFTADAVSEMLRDKSRAGRSPYYVRSLRAVCRMLLKELGRSGAVRPVRLPPLEREGWSIDDVARLIAKGYVDSQWWGTIIEAGYYTGLSLCDLLALKGSQVSQDGWVRTKRQKTGAAVLVAVPKQLAEKMRTSDTIWQWTKSLEWFRREFRRIASSVGLKGSFKMLRAASGSAVEAEYPGAGHRHLANTPGVFAKHYQTTKLVTPTMPPQPRIG
jgi:integrase